MGLRDIFGRIQTGAGQSFTNMGDYVEIEVQDSMPEVSATRYVKVCKLYGFADVDISARELSRGNVVILDIKPLAERSMNELKHAVDEIKETVSGMGGDIVGLTDYLLVLTPPHMRVERSPARSEFEESLDRVRKRGAGER
ncbi:MAG: cell division protein SepF [Euryarchaeota archaeon]|nr:cell division protein SepF [Euryarchaeota archaeon]